MNVPQRNNIKASRKGQTDVESRHLQRKRSMVNRVLHNGPNTTGLQHKGNPAQLSKRSTENVYFIYRLLCTYLSIILFCLLPKTNSKFDDSVSYKETITEENPENAKVRTKVIVGRKYGIPLTNKKKCKTLQFRYVLLN